MGLGEADRGVEDGGGPREGLNHSRELASQAELVRRLFQNDGKFTSPRLLQGEAG